MRDSASVFVKTPAGDVVGLRADGVDTFRGIPYACAPVGPRRFARPERRPRFRDVFDARRRAPAAPHAASEVGAIVGLVDEYQDEDCLHATVWTPSIERRGLPVMVWIHGGAFETGSAGNPLADGSVLARHGEVVVVSLQYRTGIIGFCDLPGAAPNRGLLDLALGLRWVAENVSAFGGDPDAMTLFGASAGGVSVATLLATPDIRPLVKRAIVQSAGLECFHSPREASVVRAEVARALGVERTDHELRDRLETLPISSIIAAQVKAGQRLEEATNGIAFAPWLGAEPIAAHPLGVIASGAARGVPMLVGTNRDEMKLLHLQSFPAAPRALSRREVTRRLDALFGAVKPSDRAMALYEGLASGRGSSPHDLLDAVLTDLHFRVPAARLASAHARHEPRTYGYVFGFRVPFGRFYGTPHAMEIPFLFGTTAVPPMPLFLGASPRLEAMSRAMQDVWLAFARTGDPSTTATGSWPRVTEDRTPVMVLDETMHVEPDFLAEEMPFWADHIASTRPVTFVDRRSEA
jgi:para-nitrobenzyl esterase